MNTKKLMYIASLLVFSLLCLNTELFAQQGGDLLSQMEAALSKYPTPPDTGEFPPVDKTAAKDTKSEKQSEEPEPNLDPKISNLGAPDEPKAPKEEVANIPPVQQGTGSPGLFFVSHIQQISAQECMRRAKAAFESQGMTIGAGDYWWYGAVEPRYHSYNNCLDIGGGNTIVNFTTASWRMDTLDHLNRLTKAYNSQPESLNQKAPYMGDVTRQVPELYMWVQMKKMSLSDCMRRATNAIKTEGLSVTGSSDWWIGGQDESFNTYITCTDLGNGNVYVNVTTTGSNKEDLEDHRNHLTKRFN